MVSKLDAGGRRAGRWEHHGWRQQARTGRRAMLLSVLALAMVSASCGEKSSSGRRALLIGIDGMSPRVTVPMIEQGRLPNLGAIAAQGVSGKLRSERPLFSPRIWNTIATGRLVRHHGIIGFVKQQRGDGEESLFSSHDRGVPALWNILSEQGLSVGVVNWWTTYPPEKINGVMVSDHFFPEQIEKLMGMFKDRSESSAALIHPESWGKRAAELLEGNEPLTHIRDPFKDNTALLSGPTRQTLTRQYQTDEQIARVALGLLEDHRPDVMMIYLPGIDRVSHWLWGNLEPADLYPERLRPTPAAREAGAEALRAYYEFTDELIGQLAKGYGPDDLVMVVSDHGFEGGVSRRVLTGKHNTGASIHGVIFAKGRGIARGGSTGKVGIFDIAPSLLAWLDLPVARNMVGKPAPFLAISAPQMIASYDDIEVERLAAEESGREEAIVEQLRALGYLEEDRPPAPEEETGSK